MTDYIIAIDQGTTSSRAILFDRLGCAHRMHFEEFEQHFPVDGWVEHDPKDILQSTLNCIEKITEGIDIRSVLTVGITNQRETTIIWDRHTGEPVYNAIVWQDRRTAAACQTLRAKPGNNESVRAKTGLILDPYFSATKIRWILDNIADGQARATSGDLLFGTVDTWLLWQLSADRQHYTDATNASRTLLFNIHTSEWDNDLLSMFDIPRCMLPEVLDSADNFGEISVRSHKISVGAMIGDQQAALVGQTCFKPGQLKSTYGTGCFVIANTGKNAIISQHRLLSTIAYRLNGRSTYALEGSVFIAGAGVQWLRDKLQILDIASESEQALKQAKDDHGVVLVPAFTGLGAPYWDAEARGSIFGLTRDTGRNTVISAMMQSIALQTRDLFSAMKADGVSTSEVRLDGGMTANHSFCQLLSDVCETNVRLPKNPETTALGAAFLAGLNAGIYHSLDDISSKWLDASSFQPIMSTSARSKLIDRWEAAVKATLLFTEASPKTNNK